MDELVTCPYCGEEISIWVDEAQGDGGQRFIEDCSVCCKPIEIAVSEGEGGERMVTASRDDD